MPEVDSDEDKDKDDAADIDDELLAAATMTPPPPAKKTKQVVFATDSEDSPMPMLAPWWLPKPRWVEDMPSMSVNFVDINPFDKMWFLF